MISDILRQDGREWIMRIFNLHDDIGAEFRERLENGKPLAFQRSHIKRLKKGEILSSAAVCWFRGGESFEEMEEHIRITAEEIRKKSKLILFAEDLDDTNTEPEFILCAEGLCGIADHPKRRIRKLYDMGVRVASLTWNETNALATGSEGDPLRGLTGMGKKAVKAMNKTGMIIDVSHANEHTFWDIIRISEKPVLATHSDCRSLCGAERNLTDQQIIALCEKGGIIGMNAWGPFISEKEENAGAGMLAKHARHIALIAGHEHIACGFDFVDYLAEYSDMKRHDLSSAKQAQNFLQALREEGFSEEEIRDIAYRNAVRFLKENLPEGKKENVEMSER